MVCFHEYFYMTGFWQSVRLVDLYESVSVYSLVCLMLPYILWLNYAGMESL